jgi:AsmA protein
MNAIKYALLGLYGVIGLFVALIGIRLPFAEPLAKQHYRYAIGGVLIVLLILSVVVGVFILSFNANNFKTEIVQYVKEHTQRDLVLQGDIKVTFFPKLSMDTGKMLLSKRNSAREFASVNNIRLYVEWFPLLRRQIVIDHLEIDGAHINLTRFKDGSTNYDDLLFRDESLAPVTFDIDNVRITNSSVNWQDEIRWQRIAMQDLQIETGSLADSVPSNMKASFHLNSEVAHSDSNVKMQSRLFYDRKEGRYEFSDIDGTLQGTAAGFSNLDLKFKGDIDNRPAQDMLLAENIAVSATGNYGQRSIETNLDVPKMQFSKDVWSGGELSLGTVLSQFDEKWTTSVRIPAFEFANSSFNAVLLDADFDFKSNGGTIDGKLSSPMSINFDTTRKLQLNAIALNISANHPMLSGELSAKVTGGLQANLDEQNANLDFNAIIDESKISGKMALKDFGHPAYFVELDINRLPLDRYIAADWIKRYQDDATRIDLSGIRDMNLRCILHAGEFKLGRVETGKLSAEINIEDSLLTIEPLVARLYGGTLSGSISVEAKGTPRITVKQHLKAFQMGLLLAATPVADKLTGNGDLTLDINAEGSSIGAMRKSLSGSVMLALTRGSLAGIDLRAALIEGKDDLGAKGNARVFENRFSERSNFSELKALFNIKNGSSRGNSFDMRSPQFRVVGKGDYAPDSGDIDYQLAATVASKLNRSSAGDLIEMRGVTVPVHASGPYASPSFALDFTAASGEIVTKKIAARVAAEQAAAKEAAKQAATSASNAKRAITSKKHAQKSTKNRIGSE